jgi:hypothetical protein
LHKSRSQVIQQHYNTKEKLNQFGAVLTAAKIYSFDGIARDFLLNLKAAADLFKVFNLFQFY